MPTGFMLTSRIGYPFTNWHPRIRYVTNLKGKVLIISFAQMTHRSRGGWLWNGQRYMLLAGFKRLPLALTYATTQENQNDKRNC
jgi:hypothetical protein